MSRSRLSRIGFPLSIVSSTARLLLYLSRQSVKVTSARVRSKRLPLGKRSPSGPDGTVDIGGRSLRHTCKFLAGRRVSGVEVFSSSRRGPCPINEVAEAALVVVEPCERLFRVFRRRTIFHSNELFSDAHR